jgi:hypothetical protein
MIQWFTYTNKEDGERGNGEQSESRRDGSRGTLLGLAELVVNLGQSRIRNLLL